MQSQTAFFSLSMEKGNFPCLASRLTRDNSTAGVFRTCKLPKYPRTAHIYIYTHTWAFYYYFSSRLRPAGEPRGLLSPGRVGPSLGCQKGMVSGSRRRPPPAPLHHVVKTTGTAARAARGGGKAGHYPAAGIGAKGGRPQPSLCFGTRKKCRVPPPQGCSHTFPVARGTVPVGGPIARRAPTQSEGCLSSWDGARHPRWQGLGRVWRGGGSGGPSHPHAELARRPQPPHLRRALGSGHRGCGQSLPVAGFALPAASDS